MPFREKLSKQGQKKEKTPAFDKIGEILNTPEDLEAFTRAVSKKFDELDKRMNDLQDMVASLTEETEENNKLKKENE